MNNSTLIREYEIRPWVYCPLCRKAHDLKDVEIIKSRKPQTVIECEFVIFICPKCGLDCSSDVKLRKINL